jgi:hypothetical protein
MISQKSDRFTKHASAFAVPPLITRPLAFEDAVCLMGNLFDSLLPFPLTCV